MRSKASELVKSKVFDSVRRPHMEQEAPFKIDLEYDREGMFDYKTFDSKYSIEDYRKILNKEI